MGNWTSLARDRNQNLEVKSRYWRIFALSALATLFCLAKFTVCVAQSVPTRGDSNQSVVRSITDALRAQNFDEALRLSHAALQKSPQDHRIWTLRGMAYSGMNKPESALDAFEHALKLAPTFLPALEGAAQIEYHRGSERARPLILRVPSPKIAQRLCPTSSKPNRCWQRRQSC